MRVKDKKIVEVEYTLALQVLNEAKLGILSAIWLAKWDDYRRIEWMLAMEYPDLVMEQTKRLLSIDATPSPYSNQSPDNLW